MSKHTPGPWEDRPQSSNAYHQIYATDGNGGLVAMVYDYCGDDTPANAKLIAAAPDMFNALQTLLSIIDNEADLAFSWPADFRERSNAYKKAKEAIAKAR